MTDLLILNPSRALDLNGYAIPGAMAYFYDSGTTAERTVYADADGVVPHTWPVVADGAGVFPQIYDIGEGEARVTVTDAQGVVLAGFPLDPAPRMTIGASGAAAIQFDPTEDIPQTNVQAAIEQVQANLIEPLADYGLGVTGNAAVVPNINAANIPSGQYRYDGTTVGTFPSGETAAAGGILEVWRQTAARSLQFLSPVAGGKIYVRVQNSGFGVWRFIVTNDYAQSEAAWVGGASTTDTLANPAAVKASIRSLAIGEGQTWQNVMGSRAVGATQINGTGRAIMVAVQFGGGDADQFQVSNTGAAWATVAKNNSTVSVIIPPGGRYRLTSGTLNSWLELR